MRYCSAIERGSCHCSICICVNLLHSFCMPTWHFWQNVDKPQTVHNAIHKTKSVTNKSLWHIAQHLIHHSFQNLVDSLLTLKEFWMNAYKTLLQPSSQHMPLIFRTGTAQIWAGHQLHILNEHAVNCLVCVCVCVCVSHKALWMYLITQIRP